MNIFKRIIGHVYFAYGMLLFAVTMTLVCVPASISLLYPEPRRAKFIHPLYKIWMSVFLPLVFCPVSRRGKEHFIKGQNYVVVVNHNSLVDIPVSMPWVPGPNKTLAKIEMTKIPLFGIIYRAGSILLNRRSDSSRKESVSAMQETLKMGLHLTLYPEGTRNKSQEPLLPFYDGAFSIAVKEQKPIIPAIIFGTKKILPHQPKFWAFPHRISFHFLPPISTKGLEHKDVKTIKEQVREIMKNYIVTHEQE